MWLHWVVAAINELKDNMKYHVYIKQQILFLKKGIMNKFNDFH